MRCASCFQNLPPGAQFCFTCGAPQGAHTRQATRASRRRAAFGATIRLPGLPARTATPMVLLAVASVFTLAVVFGVALVMAQMPDLGAGALALAGLIAAAVGVQWLWMAGHTTAGASGMLLWLALLGWMLG